MSSGVTAFIEKALSPSYYQQQYRGFLNAAHNYYHPMFRAGSATPLFHMMIGLSVIMYTSSYLTRDYKRIQHQHQVQKEALHEYYEKHGGAPEHH